VQTDGTARRLAAFKKQVRRERKTLGSVLRAAIMDSDLKQKEVAEKIGMTEAMLSDTVTGRRKTELSEIAAIARAIDTDLLKLVSRWVNW
jgi:plasmid maintenance system antidote protein VapI